ncbi:hypothetical protein SK128_024913 [Halocaridina rubra]|uniref:FYVE-type domain-containing protein n=1 Tax=Halocaridina rubra TaxID=373956 RepID=A0AAN8XB83_HALRR
MHTVISSFFTSLILVEFRNGWLIKTPTKSFAVYAATATEKTEWMAHINKCVTDLLRKSGKKAAETHAAVWVPDNDTTVCMHCKKSQFTLINRRHHCRKCGKVVCGPCSSKKVVLSHQSNKPLRVCLTCHDELSLSQSNAGGITPNITMAGRMVDLDAVNDDDDLFNISCGDESSIVDILGPQPPPRRVHKAKKGNSDSKSELDKLDDGGLFGEQLEDGEEDAPPPTLWWDDIGRGFFIRPIDYSVVYRRAFKESSVFGTCIV